MNAIVGTRGSALATIQTASVVELIRARHPEIELETRIIRTEGDIRADRPLSEIGGKGVFVKEIELALQRNEIDIAVHSLKDVPALVGEGLVIAAVLPRADARDVLITRDGSTLASLRSGAIVGTGSQRRDVQLRALRPDLRVQHIRGNVDTRLRKLDDGEFDALVLAAAGLGRLGKAARITEILDPSVMLPSVGQGALAVETRADSPLAAIVAELDDRDTRVAIAAERAFLARLGAGCELPVAAYARVSGDALAIDGMIAREDRSFARLSLRGKAMDALDLGSRLADELTARLAEVAC